MTSDAQTCRSCSAPVIPGSRFCSECGAVLTGSGGNSAEVRAPARPASGEWGEVKGNSDPLLDELQVVTRGSYEISHRLGRGGMAAVYLARDSRLRRRVAIKVMLPELRSMPTMPERFHAEAQTAAALSHPNIIVIHSVEQTGELLYFVMSYVEGLPLDEILRETGPMSIPLAQSLLAQVASALEYAHSEGVTHRDVKPANIMVNAKGDAVVTDFGIAKVASATQLTQTGATIGTAAYMSPEQCMGRDITVSSDQYSLGIVAFVMLTGRLPFNGTAFEVQMKQVQDAPPDPRSFRPDIPDELAKAILRMMAKLPKDRFASIEIAARAFGADVGRSDPGARARLAELARSGSIRRSGVQPVTPPGVVPKVVPPTVVEPFILNLATNRSRIEAGETALVTVTASDARVITNSHVQWTTSDARVIDVTPDGRVVGIAQGSGSVRAECDGVVASIDFVVDAAKVRRIAVTPESLTMKAGESATLSAIAFDARGNSLRDRRISWTSRSGLLASIAWTGEVVAVSEGRTQLVASAEGVEQAVDVIVSPAAVAAIHVEPAMLSMVAGEHAMLKIFVDRSDGAPLSGRRVRWSSSDRKIATVDDGEVTARKPGATTITAECEGCAAIVSIEVRPVFVSAPPRPPRVEPIRAVKASLGATAAVGATATESEHASPAVETSIAELATPLYGSATFDPTPNGASRYRLVAIAGGVLVMAVVGWLIARGSPVERPSFVEATPPTDSTIKPDVPAHDSLALLVDTDTAVHSTGIEDTRVVAQVRIDRPPAALDSGSHMQLTAVPVDAHGRAVASARVSWRSLTPRIASISSLGVARALSPGRARFEASVGATIAATELQVTRVVTQGPAATVAVEGASKKGAASTALPGTETKTDDNRGETKAVEAKGPEPKGETKGEVNVTPPHTTEPKPNDMKADDPPARTASISEGALRQLVVDFASLVAGRHTNVLEGLLGAASSVNTRKDFLQFVSRAPSIGASVMRANQSAAGASVHFVLTVSYRTVGGQAKERQVPFSASLVSAGGSWHLAEVRLDEPCCK